MKARRCLPIFASLSGATGFLVLFFAALSSSTAASELTIPSPVTSNDIASSHWRILADMPKGRGDPGVVSLYNKIHVVSGFFTPGYGYSNEHDVYDPQTNTWQVSWGFPVPRSDLIVANVGDKIYAIGGWNMDLGGVQGYTHMYDPSQDTWITMTSMITPVSGAAGVVLSDTIWVMGGWDGNQSTSDVQIFDPSNDAWSTGTPMSTPRAEFGAVVLDGLIYAIGGTDNINDVEIYNPVTDQWSNGPPLPETRDSMAVVERQGSIFVIGGSDNLVTGTYTDTIFLYNPVSGLWSSLPDPLPTARRACDATVISDTIYVIGGKGEPGAGTANEAYGDFEIISSTMQIIADDPDPSQAFQTIVVSYQVTSTFDVPTGIVTATVDQNNVECNGQLVNGMGSCEIVLDTPGTYTITAAYGGDNFHSRSSDNESHTVIKADTTTILGDITNPSLIGQPFIVTFNVSSTYGSPTGAVTVSVGNSQQSCSGEIMGGMGSCELVLDTPGTYTLTATYPGDRSYATSNDSIDHVVIAKLYLPFVLKD